MLIVCALLYRSRNIPATSLETKSLKVKWRLVCINLSSFALAGYAFVRHNAYCEAGSKFPSLPTNIIGGYLLALIINHN